MLKKVFLVVLILGALLLSAGCGRRVVRNVCDCDCCECGDGQEERDRYDDPGEYKGWGN